MRHFALKKAASAWWARWTWTLPAIALTLGACATGTPSAPPATPAAVATAGEAPESHAQREVVDVAWMTGDFTQQITEAVSCQNIGILVTTRGYAEGEDIHVTVGKEHRGKKRDVHLHGQVDADGQARIPWPAMGCEDNPASSAPADDETHEIREHAPAKASKHKARKPVPHMPPQPLPPPKKWTAPLDAPLPKVDLPRAAPQVTAPAAAP